MSDYIATDPHNYAHRVIGNGHCVAFVREAADVPHTSEWRRGRKVDENTPVGCAIATFSSDGRYENRTDGASHAAILIQCQPGGLLVWDQWRGKPVTQRVIRFKSGQGTANNDGSRYYEIACASRLRDPDRWA